MADRPQNLTLSSVSILSLERIDAVCGAFEDELTSDRQPRIEDFLSAENEHENQLLLREMLHLELTHKKSQGLAVTQVDYETRFSKYRDVVHHAFLERSEALPERRDYTDKTINERYQVGSLLGSGAFSDVYLAEDLQNKRPVAIKILRPNRYMDTSRLLGEARMLSELEHPNIAGAYDWGTVDDVAFIVLQFVDGITLADKIATDGPLEVGKTVALIVQICDALHLAHQKGLTHRDIKPQNILVDRSGQPFVADFGFALHESTQDQHYGDRSGTPYYRAPEQVRGEADWIDGRADVWAVGVMLYEMLSGRRPFQGDSIAEIDRQILNRSPRPLRQIDPTIPEWLEAVTQKCLAPSPADRYATAAELADALRNETHPQRALQISRRWKAMAGGLILLLALSVLAAFVFARYQQSARQNAESEAEIANAKALDMIERMIRDVQGPLKNVEGPGHAEVRKQLIENTIASADAASSKLDKATLLRAKARQIMSVILADIDDEGYQIARRELLTESSAILDPALKNAKTRQQRAPYLRMLGDIHDDLGEIDRSQSLIDEAMVNFEYARACRKEWLAIVEEYPDVLSSPFSRPAKHMPKEIQNITQLEQAQQAVAKSDLKYGQLYRSMGKTMDALPCFQYLVAARRQNFEAHPTLLAAKRDYAGALRDLGSLQVELGFFEEAERNYRDAIRLTDEVIAAIDAHPGEIRSYPPNGNCAIFLRELGELLMKQGKHHEAGTSLDEALARFDQLLQRHAGIKSRVAFLRKRLGETHFSLGIHSAWSAREKEQPQEYAVYRDQAIEYLNHAIDAGIDPALVWDDPDLQFLRGDPHFVERVLNRLLAVYSTVSYRLVP